MRSVVVVATVALIAGTIGGAAAGVFASRWWGEKPRSSETPSSNVGAAAQPRRAELEASVAPLALPIVSPTPVGSASGAPASDGQPRLEELTPSERAERWQRMYSGKIAAVQAEARDPAWAAATEASFKQDFVSQSQAFQARLVNVDCRTTGCLARVEWSSYTLAKQLFRDVLQASFNVNCASTVDIGSEPERPNDPVQAVVVFECEQARIEQTAGG